MEENRFLRYDFVAEILTHVQQRSGEDLKEALSDYHDSDIALALPDMTKEQRQHLYQALGTDAMSDVFPYCEEVDLYLSELELSEMAKFIGSMDADDATDVLDELEEDQRQQVWELLPTASKTEIQKLDAYEEDAIGSIMTANFLAVSRQDSVKEIMRTLIEKAPQTENIATIYTTNPDGTFYGTIDLKDLIIARGNTDLDDLIATSYPFVYDTEKIADAAPNLRRYSEDSIPVLNENHHLVGVVTAQDLLDLVESEQEEDYALLAGLSAEEKPKEPLWGSVKKRLPWLGILLLLGLFVSAVVGLFEGIVQELSLIVCFQSLILGMAGNVGTQSLAVTVRGMADDAPVRVGRECAVAALNGLLLGVGSVLLIGAYLMLGKDQIAVMAFSVSGCVGLALWIAMTLSGCLGTAIPLLFGKLGIDPAVASGPLITTANDLVAVCVYYGLAWLLLLQLPLM